MTFVPSTGVGPSYHFNDALQSKSDAAVEEPAATIACIDHWDEGGWFEEGDESNPANITQYDAPYLTPAGTPDTNHQAFFRHSDGGNYLFYDGHVKWHKPYQLGIAYYNVP